MGFFFINFFLFFWHKSNINNTLNDNCTTKKVKIQQNKRGRDSLTRLRGGSFLLLTWQTG